MVEAEGWASKNGSKWMTMPAQMFRYRAAAFFIRSVAPEISFGFHTQEEIQDGVEIVDADSVVINEAETTVLAQAEETAVDAQVAEQPAEPASATATDLFANAKM